MPYKAWMIAENAGQIDHANIQSSPRYSEDFYHAGGKEFDIPYARQKIRENLELKLFKNEASNNISPLQKIKLPVSDQPKKKLPE